MISAGTLFYIVVACPKKLDKTMIILLNSPPTNELPFLVGNIVDHSDKEENHTLQFCELGELYDILSTV